MRVIYSDEPIVLRPTPSLFLAGPTPRSLDVPSWRPTALSILQSFDFEGQVLVPEPSNGERIKSYDHQVEWEDEGLQCCTRIVFWVPRKLGTMNALTTNIEFGRFHNDRRSLYGRPDDADNIRYLDWLWMKHGWGVKIHNSLESLLKQAVTEVLEYV